jgi:hypothetical protein
MAAMNGTGMHALVGIPGSNTGKKKLLTPTIMLLILPGCFHMSEEATEIFHVHLENKTQIQSDQ